MPPFGFMIGSMLVQAVALYVSRKESSHKENWNFLSLGPFMLFSMVFSMIFNAVPIKLTQFNRSLELGLSTENVIFGGFCILGLIHCILTATIGVR